MRVYQNAIMLCNEVGTGVVQGLCRGRWLGVGLARGL